MEKLKKKKIGHMMKRLEYHMISHILFGFHLRLFLNTVYNKKWEWDKYHIYFCILITYILLIVLYALNVYFLLHKLDLKKYPAEQIETYKTYKNTKNVHPYAAFERPDLVNMNIYKLIYGAIFVAPWKSIILIFMAIANLLTCLFFSIFNNKENENEEDSTIVKIYLIILKVVCTFLLWVMGVNRIESHYLCDNEWPKNIVSNHTSALDPIYFIRKHACSFVAKKSLRKDFFIGLSIRVLKCVFVHREKPEDRKIALNSIRERQLAINKKKSNYPSFVIFSEGTTTNGKQIVEQKKGAFYSLLPVTPVLLIFQYDFLNPSYDVIPYDWWVILMICNYQSIGLKAYWLPAVYPPSKEKYPNLTTEERIDMFHDEVSKIMFQNMKKYNPKAPQDIDDYNDWPGSLRIKYDFFGKALGKIADKYFKNEKEQSKNT
ncbi:phospholipid or glycerol acyltransferase, putative [Plasmodium berghei]|uniref:Phospholipid or glycerol acyltransferase, putative n=2 Tax=Plasmodium berghei TaxID=5821 RepID=A0A509AKV5_PLABA|nr:phospholipid or glycerol acyltransferase, putative [Plasmodium berghei ANKA]CXI32070.1 phospholipid or glycerol acyltransferase, putative [Plasmodium berghei]SCM21086.1 phospholipid or glycerol acyltransferase, putative [Plasmodium berghei]SCN24453.1 phospholipid or glycerol acyltransferase, putative [Plasmodium berghei]SCO59640.1 phospholipid or glycerol acyltransferase, putative [Plasmodium berghei]SCO60820.1 phospholipid or glycerol acyltransferase, putative [Plasmodium berghei]|eukprot:XP_034421124.1 phospholipid or glycerol acyltransferase, putative [Plasmodium berghei ANKA]